MPHLSPMYWTTMLIFSWAFLNMIIISLSHMKIKSMTTNKNMMMQNKSKWKWY